MKSLYKQSLVHSLGILAYIAAVSHVMTNGEKWFGKMDNFIGPIAFLLLFTLSAFVVGLLGLGKPIMFFLDGKKKEAVMLVSLVAGWLFVFTIIMLPVLRNCHPRLDLGSRNYLYRFRIKYGMTD